MTISKYIKMSLKIILCLIANQFNILSLVFTEESICIFIYYKYVTIFLSLGKWLPKSYCK